MKIIQQNNCLCLWNYLFSADVTKSMWSWNIIIIIIVIIIIQPTFSIQSNPDENNSYYRWVHFDFFPTFPDMLEKCKGDLLEVKDGQSKTHHFLLENLVYFVEVSLSPSLNLREYMTVEKIKEFIFNCWSQTVCIVLWVSNYCGSVLRPLKSSLQKKKKKKKEASTVTVVRLWSLLNLSPESIFTQCRVGGNVGQSCLCADLCLPHSRRCSRPIRSSVAACRVSSTRRWSTSRARRSAWRRWSWEPSVWRDKPSLRCVSKRPTFD